MIRCIIWRLYFIEQIKSERRLGVESLIPDASILLWAVEMTWRLDTQLASRRNTMRYIVVEVSLVDRIQS